jgi:hypothetical protein
VALLLSIPSLFFDIDGLNWFSPHFLFFLLH